MRSVETNETHLSLVFAGSAPLDVPWDGSGIPEWPQAAEILKIISNQQHNVVHCLEAWLQTMDLSQAEAQEWIHNDHDHAALLLGSLDVKIVRDLLRIWRVRDSGVFGCVVRGDARRSRGSSHAANQLPAGPRMACPGLATD